MKIKLKAVQILEIMLDNPLNNKRIFDQSDDTVYNGEEWLHIDEALAELEEFITNSNREIQSLKDKLAFMESCRGEIR